MTVLMVAAWRMQAHTDTSSVSGSKIVRSADKILDWRDARERRHADTSRMMRAPERIRLTFRLNSSGTDIVAEGNGGNGNFRSELGAGNRIGADA